MFHQSKDHDLVVIQVLRSCSVIDFVFFYQIAQTIYPVNKVLSIQTIVILIVVVGIRSVRVFSIL